MYILRAHAHDCSEKSGRAREIEVVQTIKDENPLKFSRS